MKSLNMPDSIKYFVKVMRVFPHIYWTKRNPMKNTEDRKNKLIEEMQEVKDAKTNEELLDETLDVLHCCLEIIRYESPYKLYEAIEKHNAKNRERGYYRPKYHTFVFDELELYK